MKKITLIILFVGLLISSPKVFSQCTDFSGGPYTDFNGTFGGAPCEEALGCPFNEITAFEIWADEAYLMDGVQAGSIYTFSACNSAAGPGTGGQAWNLSFTIIAPSGAIDASGLDGGSTCALTWTASETGQYTIVISEAGIPCDTSTNQNTDNGYPAITCSDGNAPCPVAPDAVTLLTPTDGETGVLIDNSDPGGDLIISFDWENAATGGTPSGYDFSLGTTPAGNDIGTLPDLSNSAVNLIYTWAPNTTYYWYVEAKNVSGTAPASAIFSFTTADCTDAFAPAAATNPGPADGSTVDLNADQNSLVFTWTEDDPDDFYVINIGTVNPPDNAISSFDNGDNLINLTTETTYYWSIESVNCVGRTTSSVWSFTTSDTLLSVDDNETISFSAYPNPTSSILNIKTVNDIDSVNVYNLLGQTVASFKDNQIINNSVDLSDIANGVYLVKVAVGNKTKTIQVIKE